jgi:hypothetical protein
MRRRRQSTTATTSSLVAVGAVAALAYLSTLLGDFTFDDNFAVVRVVCACGAAAAAEHTQLPVVQHPLTPRSRQITNGDVTHDDRPLSALFKHDFWWVGWCGGGAGGRASESCLQHRTHSRHATHTERRGQDIASRQSHKSYRPLTILVFRLTRQAWGLLTALAPPGLEQQLPRAPPALPALAAGRVEEADGSRRTRPPGVLCA